MDKIHTLFLFTGYVETSSVACLVARHWEGFDDIELALESLARAIIEPRVDELKRQNACTKHLNDFDGTFCSGCGKFGTAEIELPPNDNTIEKWIREFMRGTLDFIGGRTFESLADNGWNVGSEAFFGGPFLLEGVYVVYESAETLLRVAYTKKPKSEREYLEFPEEHTKKIC